MARAEFEVSVEGITRLTLADRLTAAIESVAAGPDATERAVWGLEARYYVRGGMDPALSTPEALNGAVRAILSGSETSTAHLNPAERAQVAASLLVGWVTHHEIERPEVLAWFRLHGTSAVEVTAEKEQEQ